MPESRSRKRCVTCQPQCLKQVCPGENGVYGHSTQWPTILSMSSAEDNVTKLFLSVESKISPSCEQCWRVFYRQCVSRITPLVSRAVV